MSETITFKKLLGRFEFKSAKHKKAFQAWRKAMDMVGPTGVVAKLSGIPQSKVSLIAMGRIINDKDGKRRQILPTPEQAVRMALLTKGEVRAEQLLPNHNFDYIYKYAEGIANIKFIKDDAKAVKSGKSK